MLFRAARSANFNQPFGTAVPCRSTRPPIDVSQDLPRLRSLVDASVRAARAGLCGATLPHVLLTDVFDLLTLGAAEQLFACIEDNLDVWKEKQFFNVGRNMLLRICNGEERKISRRDS